ncbi:tetratricopeptide repeat protein [Candidatus Electronema sp. PJ]|uniref:tetratricopeptide repeat protein n=1 Tax=Candidatus Electronema sp. PJ TaxID=3401572 RepID=UPI003AA86C7F
MKNASVWITQYQQPLLLICYSLLVFALLLKCGERKGRLPHLIFFLILFVMAAVIFLGKDDKAVWIPAMLAFLFFIADKVKNWKPADKPDGMRQYEEELKTLRQQILDLQASGSMADDKQRQLLEAQLQGVQEHLTDIRESWKEEQLRRKAADEALDQMKCQMPDARIEKAQVSLRQGDTKAAKETFAEVRKQAGKAAALAAHHEGKLAESEVNYAEAMELYRVAVLLERDNPDYLLAAGQMARTLFNHAQAQEWLERLLRIREEEDKDGLDFARAAHELAWCYEYQGRYNAAEPLYKRSLEIWEQATGIEYLHVAAILRTLANLYRYQGRYAEAEPLCKRSLEIFEQALGKEHSHVTTTLRTLANLYRDQGRYEEAEPLFQRALSILQAKLPAGHSRISGCQKDYDEMKEKMAGL